MQATKETRRRTGSVTIALGLALLGLLVVLALLDDVPGRGRANGTSIDPPAGSAIHQDRADSIARWSAESAAIRPSVGRPTDRPWRPTDRSRPAFTGDRQEQIEQLRID